MCTRLQVPSSRRPRAPLHRSVSRGSRCPLQVSQGGPLQLAVNPCLRVLSLRLCRVLSLDSSAVLGQAFLSWPGAAAALWAVELPVAGFLAETPHLTQVVGSGEPEPLIP